MGRFIDDELVKFNDDIETKTDKKSKKNHGKNKKVNKQSGLFTFGVIVVIVALVILVGKIFFFNDKEYNVVFNTGEGSRIASQVVSKGNQAAKPSDPTREGYIFITWNYKDSIYDFNSKINEDIELVAVWEKVEGECYVVTFDSAGGSDIAKQVIDKDNKLIKPTDPTREGYTFKGWYLGDVAFDFTMEVNEDITLVAKWEEKVVNNNSSNNNSGSSQVVATKYGDANVDGVINSVDSMVVLQYVSGKKSLTGQALKNADINGDGNVNKVDSVLILGSYTGRFNHDGSSPLTNYILYGDSDLNGDVTSIDATLILQHAEGVRTLTGQALKNADINGDGKVTGADARLALAVDVELLSHNVLNPLTNYVLYGDTNQDGEVTSVDALRILQHVNGKVTLVGQELKNADINGDGKVNTVDSQLVLGAETKHFKHDILSPLTNYILYGDVNEDGNVTSTDATLILQHYNKKITLTGQALKNADVNADGSINAKDSTLVLQFEAGSHKGTLPFSPIK